MIGIYKITNKINYKVYIGQSINIEERWKQHKIYYSNKNLKEYNTKFYKAIRKYGIENFDFEVIEECPIELLNEREKYWIYIFDSFNLGYNSTIGGQIGDTKNENHPMTNLTNNDILNLKNELLNTSVSQYVLANKYNITQSEISNINQGKRWRDIGNFNYPIRSLNQSGEKNPKAIFTNLEVMQIRVKYQYLTGKQIYDEYKNKCSYTTFERILIGKTYNEIPVYKKKEKKWII